MCCDCVITPKLSNENSKRTKACTTLILYVSDVASDIYNGYNLYQDCHFYFAIATFSWIGMPGIVGVITCFLRGIKERNCKKILLGITFPLFIIPMTIWCMVKHICSLSDEDMEDSKK